jgi:hypothetical protein
VTRRERNIIISTLAHANSGPVPLTDDQLWNLAGNMAHALAATGIDEEKFFEACTHDLAA